MSLAPLEIAPLKEPAHGASSNGAAASNGADSLPPAPAVIEATKATVDMLAADPAVAARLALAATAVRMTFTDAGDRQLILRFDREPVEIVDGGDDAHCAVALHMPTGELHRFWTGATRPAIAILEGAARYEGPVRKALRVFPILQIGRDIYLNALEDWRSSERGGGTR